MSELPKRELSAAEREQRREAARARWQRTGERGLKIGAGVGAGLGAVGGLHAASTLGMRGGSAAAMGLVGAGAGAIRGGVAGGLIGAGYGALTNDPKPKPKKQIAVGLVLHNAKTGEYFELRPDGSVHPFDRSLIGKADRIEALAKRKAGTPLSEEEREQRREAAKKRWSLTTRGGAIGSGVGTGLGIGYGAARMAHGGTPLWLAAGLGGAVAGGVAGAALDQKNPLSDEAYQGWQSTTMIPALGAGAIAGSPVLRRELANEIRRAASKKRAGKAVAGSPHTGFASSGGDIDAYLSPEGKRLQGEVDRMHSYIRRARDGVERDKYRYELQDLQMKLDGERKKAFWRREQSGPKSNIKINVAGGSKGALVPAGPRKDYPSAPPKKSSIKDRFREIRRRMFGG